MAVLETLVRHPSDWIDWIDRSGFSDPAYLPRVQTPLILSLTQAPPDLRVLIKTGRALLWRQLPSLNYSVAGLASEAQRQRPNDGVYPISGEVSDPEGRFFPRRFSLNAGQAAGHVLNLYRTPAATRFRSAGGLRGLLRFEDDTPGAWSVIELSVTPPIGPVLNFTTQADGNGEFLLPLDHLPALTKDSPSKEFPAVMTIRGASNAYQQGSVDPDQLPVVNIFPLQPGANEPRENVDLVINPGLVIAITSHAQNHIRLRV